MAADRLITEAQEVEAALKLQIQKLGLIQRKVTALLDRKGRLSDYDRVHLVSLIKLAKGEPDDER